ncbi:PopZ family protein [Hansschlegelia beijingensis]
MAEEPTPPTASAAPKAADRPPASRPPESTERLLSEAADDAVSNAFGSLANTILSNNARTLDDIVKEMLRPMLRAWLDDNLPPLVERLVRNEIERVARGGR